MAHLQYMPGDPHLVDQLVYELKSEGIFDQFRKECIADVDTKPAYQNLRQRVESSVSTFLSRQKWKPDLNKNQLREKLRKHILDGNYLEQGLERIVDQVVNPKIASVFIPQVEDLVYNYLGIPRKKPAVETDTDDKDANILIKDAEAVSSGSVKPEDKNGNEMVIDENSTLQNNDSSLVMDVDKHENHNTEINDMILVCDDSIDKNSIPLPTDDIQLSVPIPENSPPYSDPMLEGIMLPKDQIPLPKEMPPETEDRYFKSIDLLSNDDSSTSDSTINRNMSPLTPIRNFDEDNSCDAQQGFEKNDNDIKYQVNSFKFSIEKKSPENSQDGIVSIEKKDLTQHFESAINIPLYSESSNSNNLQIDYESDANTKVSEKTEDTMDKKEKEKDKKPSHKSSHNSRDKHRHSSSRDKKDSKDSKHSSSRDKDKEKKRDDKKSSHGEKSRDRSEKKDTKESKDSKDKHRSSSHKSSSHSSSSKHRNSTSSKHSSKDEKKSKSTSDKDKKEHRSSSKSQRSEKDRKSSRSKDDKDKDKKDKKKGDDHYSASGRNNHGRRSTDRDSNDGHSTSSKGSNVHPINKTTENKSENKSGSKSENTTSGSGSTSPSDKDKVNNKENITDTKPMSAIRIETHLNTPIMKSPMRLMPEVVLKKPKFANNFEEAKKLMKMRKFMDEEQKRMNQEAALLLEFQANVRPSLSQVYSSIPGPELEFVCRKSPVREDKYDEFKSLQEEMNNPVAENDELDDDAESQLVICEDVDVELREDNDVDNKIELKDETLEMKGETLVQDDVMLIEAELKTDETMIQKQPEDESQVKSELNTQVVEENDSNIEAKVLTDYFEVTVTADDASSTDDCKSSRDVDFELLIDEQSASKATDNPLRYFNQQEIYKSEVELDSFKALYAKYQENTPTKQRKLFLFNCDSFHKNIFNHVTKNNYEIVCYNRNGHIKTQEVKKIKNIDKEISIPETTPISSPIKTDFSFELSSDYESRLDDMMNSTSRQQIMEIILGGALSEGSPSKLVMPKIDICQESRIDFDSLKRKMDDENDNNNDVLLSANKMRRISESEEISSTTEEVSHTPNYSLKVTGARSKYLGKARRIGLPRPKRTVQPNSPSSDKSVENYEQNAKLSPEKVNGKIKSTPRAKPVQRYDTTDLYKPKLHFLSRRNNVT